jgi:hypothetical protein
MTKPASSFDPPLGVVKDRHELHSIWSALEGDPRSLHTRLRVGIATNLEMGLAARLNAKEITPRSPRRGLSRQRRLEIAQVFAALKERFPHRLRKQLAGEVCKRFGVSVRRVDYAVEEFGPEALSEIKRITNALVDFRVPDRDSLVRLVESIRARARK